MKVFVPVTDEIIGNADALMAANMVPFDPAFLSARADTKREGFKPRDWISSSDCAEARERLRASLAEANS